MRKYAKIAALAVLFLLTVVRVTSTYRVFSETNDEPVHLAAGFEWLATGKYELDREHPPLPRVLFALGPWLAGATASPSEDRVAQGNTILYRDGRYVHNLAVVRAGNLPFYLLALIVVTLWTRRVSGNAAAILALALTASLPPILGHAGLATTDMAAAATTIAALFAFALWFERPTWRRAIILGAAIGLGLLSKMSFIAFFPVGAVLFSVLGLRQWLEREGRAAAVQTVGVFFAALVVLWAGYRFDSGTLQEVRVASLPNYAPEYHAARYANEPGYEWVRGDILERYWKYSDDAGSKLIDFVDWAKAAGYQSPLAGRHGRDTMAGFPPIPPLSRTERMLEPFRRARQWVVVHVPLPAPQFLVGVKYVQLHSKYGHPGYLFGERRDTGWWYYFPVLFFFKTPIPFIVLCVTGTILLAIRGWRERSGEKLCIAVAPWLMMCVALTSKINIGVRHILPMYPLLAISAASAAVWMWQSGRAQKAIVALLLAWHFITTTLAHPDYLAWFNELAGQHPHRIALDSNLDWGQDLLRLERVAREKKLEPLYIAYFGSARRDALSVKAEEPPNGACRPGWFAVSEMRYYGDERLVWLQAHRPVGRIGKSIRLYHIRSCGL